MDEAFPLSYSLQHEWYTNVKPHQMSYNTMRFRRIDAETRVKRQQAWNEPRYWPIVLLFVLFVLGTIPAVITSYIRERRAG